MGVLRKLQDTSAAGAELLNSLFIHLRSYSGDAISGHELSQRSLPQRFLSRQLPSWQMVRALEYMNARGKSSFSLVELCSTVGTGATRFIQLFKNSVSNGMSPHLFYNHLIVSKAKRLLREPTFSVKRGFLRSRFPEREPLLQGVSGLHGIDPQRFPPFRAGLLPGDSRLHPSLIVFCRPGQQNEISYNCSLWAQGLHARCACYKW